MVPVSIQILRYSGIVPAAYYYFLATTKDDEKAIKKHLNAQLVAPLAQFNATVIQTPNVKNAIDKTAILGKVITIFEQFENTVCGSWKIRTRHE